MRSKFMLFILWLPLAACGGKGSPGSGSPQSGVSPVVATPADFAGEWQGTGQVETRNLWSLSYDRRIPSPSLVSCAVTILISHRGGKLYVDTLGISFPGQYDLRYFRANIVDFFQMGDTDVDLQARKFSTKSRTGYRGAYLDGGGALHTATIEAQAELGSDGLLSKGRFEMWSYGGSVSHATDAACEGVTLKKR